MRMLLGVLIRMVMAVGDKKSEQSSNHEPTWTSYYALKHVVILSRI